MTCGSLFAGIGGFDLGFERAGMDCLFQVERDATARRVLREHWPTVPQHLDVCEFARDESTAAFRPDVLCGGFPCQDLSVAGSRAGLAGKRSGLFFEFMRIVGRLTPGWVVIENVPGLLSSNGGRDFGTVLGTLGKLGYGYAYRVLDAQFHRVAQRRRRVFIVGCAGSDWRSAAEVLFEREGLPWDSPPSREAGSVAARCVAPCLTARYAKGTDSDASDALIPCESISVTGRIAHTLTAEGHDASEDGTGRGTPIAYQCHGSNVGPMGTLRAGNGNASGGVPFIATDYSTGAYRESDRAAALTTGTDATRSAPIVVNRGVRRLMPKECERLQGFPDGWTAGHSDSARYRMLGNAVAVPVAEWIGKRIVNHPEAP